VATLPLKTSHNEQCSVIRFLWAKKLVKMAFILRCIQYMVTSVLQDQQYMFGVSCSLVDKKVLKKKDLADVFFRQLMQ